MGKSFGRIQKVVLFVLTAGFFIALGVIFLYSVVAYREPTNIDLFYEKNQEISIALPLQGLSYTIKYKKGMGGKKYSKLIQAKAMMKKDSQNYSISADLVVANATRFNNLQLIPLLTFPKASLSSFSGMSMRSGFTLFKRDLMFLTYTALQDTNNLTIFSPGGNKIDKSIYLSRAKVFTPQGSALSFNKVVFSKQMLKASNIFVRWRNGAPNMIGFANKLTIYRVDENNIIGEAAGVNFTSLDILVDTKKLNFEKRGDALVIYLLGKKKLRFIAFSLFTHNPAVVYFAGGRKHLFVGGNNIIRSEDFVIEGKDIYIKRLENNKVWITASENVWIKMLYGTVYSKKFVVDDKQRKYRFIGDVKGFFFNTFGNIELSAEDLIIKEQRNKVYFYSSRVINFKVGSNVIKAREAIIDRQTKAVVFSNGRFFVVVRRKDGFKIKMLSERIKIFPRNVVMLSGRFIITATDDFPFEKLSGEGFTIVSATKVDSIGDLYTKWNSKEFMAYRSKKQYIDFSEKALKGFSRENVFSYQDKLFFGDSFNLKKDFVKICNSWGISLRYSSANIKVKCVKYYFTQGRFVLPAGMGRGKLKEQSPLKDK
jgi:hypothetical protein